MPANVPHETLASFERIARGALELTSSALRDPRNEPILEEIHATFRVATELLVNAEVGQWTSIEVEQRRALARATDLAVKLHAHTGWVNVQRASRGFLHNSLKEQ